MPQITDNPSDFFDTSNVLYLGEDYNQNNSNNLRQALDEYDDGIHFWDGERVNKLEEVVLINGVLQIPEGWRKLDEFEIIRDKDRFRGVGMVHWYQCGFSVGKLVRESRNIVIR